MYPFLFAKPKNQMKETILIAMGCMLMGSTIPVAAQDTATVTGRIYDDRNGNNLPDTGEKGLRGIAVSNGDTLVLTDRRGRFCLPLQRGQSLFPILPADRSLSASPRVVNAGFYTWMPDASAPGGEINFGLARKHVKKQFSLNAIGDVQVGDEQEMDYAARTLWPELLHEDAGAVNLFLGDLVNNNLALLPPLKQLMEQLPAPSWTVVGNHDRDADTVRMRQTASYSAVFGAPAYAFNEGNVHFIVLNNVYGKGKRSYTGRLSEAQLRFVENDLKLIHPHTQLVLAMHIPLAQTSNARELTALLKGRGDVLVLSGHLHRVARYFLSGDGVCIHELSAGASCGFWWVGEKDWEGIPAALMQCGTPRSYFTFRFSGQGYTFSCKGIGMDASRQMGISVAGIDSTVARPAGEVYLTVYGASDSTTVRCRIDDGRWMACSKVRVADINVERIRRWNSENVYPTRYSRIDPFRGQPSPQVWMFTLPPEYRRGAHVVRAEAEDRWGFHASGSRSFVFTDTSVRP